METMRERLQHWQYVTRAQNMRYLVCRDSACTTIVWADERKVPAFEHAMDYSAQTSEPFFIYDVIARRGGWTLWKVEGKRITPLARREDW